MTDRTGELCLRRLDAAERTPGGRERCHEVLHPVSDDGDARWRCCAGHRWTAAMQRATEAAA